MNVARSQPSPYTLREKLLTYLHNTSLLNLQNAFENAQADPNMLLLADRDDLDRSGNAYTMLNWACYYRFEEGIAFLLLKGGDPFLRTQQISETEHHEISPSAIETVLHWYSKPEYSECCAYILAMINYHDNPVTDIGRDPDAYIINNERRKECPLAYAIELEYFWGIRWLIQNRHASVHVQDEYGYDPIDCCFIRIERNIEDYKKLSQRDPSDRNLDFYKESNVRDLRKSIHMIYWIKACMDDRLNLHKYRKKYPEAITYVENNPQLADKNNEDLYHTVEEQSKAVQQRFNPVLAKRGRESGDLDMHKRFRNPQASIAQPKHPHSLPLLQGLSIQHQQKNEINANSFSTI